MENYVPPVELHVVLAGGAVAAGLAAIGLSMRRKLIVGAIISPPPAELTDIGYVFNPAARCRRQTRRLSSARWMMLLWKQTTRRQPVARFWVLGLLLAIATVLTGYWTMSGRYGYMELEGFVSILIRDNAAGKDYRLNAHRSPGRASFC